MFIYNEYEQENIFIKFHINCIYVEELEKYLLDLEIVLFDLERQLFQICFFFLLLLFVV